MEKELPLLSKEDLTKFFTHTSPLVRHWAWEFVKNFNPFPPQELLSFFWEETDPLVLGGALNFFKKNFSSLSPEEQEKLFERSFELLNSKEGDLLFLEALALLSQKEGFFSLISRYDWIMDRILHEEKNSFSLQNILLESLTREVDLLNGKVEVSSALKAYYLGKYFWETGDLNRIKENIGLVKSNWNSFLKGLSIVFWEDEYFPEILPLDIRSIWEKEHKNKKERQILKIFIQEEFKKLEEEVKKNYGELNLKRHLKKTQSLGLIFRLLEFFINFFPKRPQTEELDILMHLLLVLLWGKPLLGMPENLSFEEALKLYADEKRPIFPEDKLLKERLLFFLKENPSLQKRIERKFQEIVDIDSYGTERLITLIDECENKFVPFLLNIFENILSEKEESPYIETYFEKRTYLSEVRKKILDFTSKYKAYYLLFILNTFPAKDTVFYLSEHFEELLEKDILFLRDIIEYHPDISLWNKIKEYIHPELLPFKKIFVIFANIFEPSFPGLKDLEEKVYQNEIQSLKKGPFSLEKFQDIFITLKCPQCKSFYSFIPKKIFLLKTNIDLPEKIICPKCGLEDEFIIPSTEIKRILFLVGANSLLKEEDKIQFNQEILKVSEIIIKYKGKIKNFDWYRDALKFYRKVVKENPSDPELISGYIHILLYGLRLEEAEKAFQLMEKISKESVDYLFLKGNYYRFKEEHQNAIHYYKKALEAISQGKPIYKLEPQDRPSLLRSLYIEIKEYAKSKGLKFDLKEDMKSLPRKRKVGRNDPCPCGSGKKYKKCCLNKDRERQKKVQESETTNVENRSFDIYIEYLFKKYGNEIRNILEKNITPLKEIKGVQENIEFLQNFLLEYITFFGKTSEDKNFLQDFLDNRGYILSAKEREILYSALKAYPGIFEIQETNQEEGISICQNLITKDHLKIKDFSIARQYFPEDNIFITVYPFKDYFRAGGFGVVIPPLKRSLILEELRALFESSGEKDFRSFAREHAFEIFSKVLKISYSDQEIHIFTPEGDEVLFARAHYELLSSELEKDIADAGFQKGNDHQYLLLEKAEGSFWSIPQSLDLPPGSIIIKSLYMGEYKEIGTIKFLPEKNRVILEAISRPRLKKLREAFESIAEDKVRFLVEEFLDWRQIKSKDKAEESASQFSPEEEKDIRWLEYLAWLDTPEPELEGKTPREAWKDPSLKGKVEKMLKRFEKLEDICKNEGKPTLDIKKLRSYLPQEVTNEK